MASWLPVETVRALMDLFRMQYDGLLPPIRELRRRLLGVACICIGGVQVHVDHVRLDLLLYWMRVNGVALSHLVPCHTSLMGDAISGIRKLVDRRSHRLPRCHPAHSPALMLRVWSWLDEVGVTALA